MISSPSDSIPALPTITDLSVCSNPIHKIHCEQDISNWIDSEAYERLQIIIVRLNYAVQGLAIEDAVHESQTVKSLVEMLQSIEAWVDDIPLDTTPQRFGNTAFRVWYKRLILHAEELQKTIVPSHLQPILPELIHHFTTCFGSSARIDYGTGHELSFLAYLLIMRLVGVLDEQDEPAMVTRVFAAYLKLVRKLQKVYRLEPAGSKGVWGLDDHQHLVYIWGASQLKTHASLRPSSILTPSSISPHGVSYLFLSSILHIRELKTGPFAEHSPMLHSIASTVPNWTKVNSGLMRMYEEEVLKKVPVVQHFWFGGLLAWRRKATGEMMQSSGDGKEIGGDGSIEQGGEDERLERLEVREEKDEGTKAPWAIDHASNAANMARRSSFSSSHSQGAASPLSTTSATLSSLPPPSSSVPLRSASSLPSQQSTVGYTSSGPSRRQAYSTTYPAPSSVDAPQAPTGAPQHTFAPPMLFPGSSTRSASTTAGGESKKEGGGPEGDGGRKTLADSGSAAAMSSPFGALGVATLSIADSGLSSSKGLPWKEEKE